MKIYIIRGDECAFCGDHYDWLVAAYFDKDKAEALCFCLNDKLDQLSVLSPTEASKEMQKIDSRYSPMSDYSFYVSYSVQEVEVEDSV